MQRPATIFGDDTKLVNAHLSYMYVDSPMRIHQFGIITKNSGRFLHRQVLRHKASEPVWQNGLGKLQR